MSQPAPRPLPKGPIPAKVGRYARRLFSRYDVNGDGLIDTTEQRQMQGTPNAIDYDADGNISFEELAAFTGDFGRHRRMRLTGSMVDEAVAELPPLYIPTAERDAMAAAQQAAQQPQQTQEIPVALIDDTVESVMESTDEPEVSVEGEESEESEEPSQPGTEQSGSKRFVTPESRLTGLPKWFLDKDSNGDGQLTVAEYAPDSQEAHLAQFAHYDRNNDGVLTAQECPKQ